MATSDFESIFNDSVIPVFESFFGVAVRLARGPLLTAEFTARRSDVVHEAVGQDFGLEIRVIMRDFLLPVASVVIDGDEIEPRTGDRLMEGSEVFEVLPPDANTPSVERPAGGHDWLVHTKRVQ